MQRDWTDAQSSGYGQATCTPPSRTIVCPPPGRGRFVCDGAVTWRDDMSPVCDVGVPARCRGGVPVPGAATRAIEPGGFDPGLPRICGRKRRWRVRRRRGSSPCRAGSAHHRPLRTQRVHAYARRTRRVGTPPSRRFDIRYLDPRGHSGLSGQASVVDFRWSYPGPELEGRPMRVGELEDDDRGAADPGRAARMDRRASNRAEAALGNHSTEWCTAAGCCAAADSLRCAPHDEAPATGSDRRLGIAEGLGSCG